jgi:hypothetical protein
MRFYFLAGCLISFLGLAAQTHHSIIITELMPDPSPTVGLPPYEWIEIRNRTGQPIQLQQWRVGTATSLSGPLPAYWLGPDSLLILCSVSALPSLTTHGNVLAVSNFPALDNEGTTVWLRHPSGSVIHAVSYDKSWYKNLLKAEGGWSIEMIDWRWPCAAKNNWRASIQSKGGTPGELNSVQDLRTELSIPTAVHSYASDTNKICVQFSSAIDSNWAVQPEIYQLNRGIRILSARTRDLNHTLLELNLDQSLQTDSVYLLSWTGTKTCYADTRGASGQLKTGRASSGKAREMIINELLFNPRSGGSDFIECFNNSDRILDLSTLYITNRQPGGSLGFFVRLSQTPRLFFPGEYYSFSSEPALVMQQYLVTLPMQLLQTNGFPSLPDETGHVVLLNQQGEILDELQYNEQWHFPLLENKEGVSLERINPDERTQWAGNWHSAAKTEGFATPCRKNSQQPLSDSTAVAFRAVPQLFTPNLDGQDDICTIYYQTEQPGTLASVQIMDPSGRLVRALASRSLLGRIGHWYWDGRDSLGNLLNTGNYLLVITTYTLQGVIKQYRQGIALWR